MTDYQIQQREEQRLHLVAEGDRVRRLAALECALAAEVNAHTEAKLRIRLLEARLAKLQNEALPPASAIACKSNGVELFALYDLDDDGVAVTAVHVAQGQDIAELLSSDDLRNLEGQIADTLAEQARDDADDAAIARHEAQMLRWEA
jgi:hypothetical protein